MKTLKKFEFAPKTSRATQKYNWDKYLDGGIYQFEEGTDYTCSTLTFRAMATRQGALKHGKHVETQNVEGGCVISATRPLTDDENATWKAQEAKLKEGAARRREERKAAAQTNGEAHEEGDDEPGADEAE